MQIDPITDKVLAKLDDNTAPRIEYYYRFPQVDVLPKKGMFRNANFEFAQKWVDVTPVFNLVSGMMGAHPILSLTPFEVVDAHEWHGQKPFHITTRDGSKILEHMPKTWQIGSMNLRTGERFPMLHSVANRDQVNRVNYQLNRILDYSKSILSMFEHELAEKGEVPLDELKGAIAENPVPSWQ